MKSLLYLCLVPAVSLAAFAAATPDDTQALQGLWLPVKAELAGQPFPDAILKTISLRLFDRGKYEVMAAGKPDRGTCVLDSTAKPKGMIITGTDGVNARKTYPAIYEIDGDVLRICYDLSGAKRPTEFTTTPGTQLYLVTYNRKKE